VRIEEATTDDLIAALSQRCEGMVIGYNRVDDNGHRQTETVVDAPAATAFGLLLYMGAMSSQYGINATDLQARDFAEDGE
jgi:hypothetical protein